MTIEAVVTPEDVAAPSPDVAHAVGRILHDLAGLRASRGEGVAQVEAMAMLSASAAFLRPRLGEDGIDRVIDSIIEAERRRRQR